MKKNKSILIVLFVLSITGFATGQVDYILGKIEYEQRYGTEQEKELARLSGYQSIKKDSDKGHSEAQYYLATIHLSDPIYLDTLQAIELLKKSAHQRNKNAISKLDELKITDYIVPIDLNYWKRTGLITVFIFGYLLLSAIAYKRVNLSSYLTRQAKRELKGLIWFLPVVGALIGIKRSNRLIQPINDEDINWVANSFSWIEENFSKELIQRRSVLGLGDLENINGNTTKNDAKKLVHEIAELMDIKKGLITVSFYQETQFDQFEEIEIRQFDNVEYSTGKYFGKDKSGKFKISLEENLLYKPTNLVATIAHELSHVKLLGERRIKENDEYLTDLLPIAYGFGVFGANSIFNSDTTSFYWSMNRQGYLGEKVYTFALAWYSILRKEKDPIWKNLLKPNILNEFETSLLYIEHKEKSR